jgi:hypothetical protein
VQDGRVLMMFYVWIWSKRERAPRFRDALPFRTGVTERLPSKPSGGQEAS